MEPKIIKKTSMEEDDYQFIKHKDLEEGNKRALSPCADIHLLSNRKQTIDNITRSI
jgi:hypothetical protein